MDEFFHQLEWRVAEAARLVDDFEAGAMDLDALAVTFQGIARVASLYGLADVSRAARMAEARSRGLRLRSARQLDLIAFRAVIDELEDVRMLRAA